MGHEDWADDTESSDLDEPEDDDDGEEDDGGREYYKRIVDIGGAAEPSARDTEIAAAVYDGERSHLFNLVVSVLTFGTVKPTSRRKQCDYRKRSG
jgi:hypothetical protein